MAKRTGAALRKIPRPRRDWHSASHETDSRASQPVETSTPLPESPGGHGRAVPAVIGLATFALYSALAVRQHQLFRTGGYDLGIFGQYAKSFAHLQAPTSTLLAKGAYLSQAGPNLFGDHFSPILALLGPLYWLYPHVEALLVVQAGLVALSAAVVARCATRWLGRRQGAYIGIAYALSWGIQQLIGFDFHEVAFAVPLISLAIAAYLEGRWPAAALWSLPLLLVKEDLGLTVFAFGLLLARRSRRVGIALCIVGPIAIGIALFTVIPHFTPGGSLGRAGEGTDQGGGYAALLSHPWVLPYKLVWPPVKDLTILMLLVPVGFVALRSPLILLVMPTLLWRFSASTPSYWGLSWHYSAILMPIVFGALVDVLRRVDLQDSIHGMLPRRVVFDYVPIYAAVVAVALSIGFPLHQLTTPSFWETSDRVRADNAAIKMVPQGALVAATNDLSPHLVDTATVYPLVDIGVVDRLPHPVGWIVADLELPDLKAPPGVALIQHLRAEGFCQVFDQDGVVVLHRP